jgi:hypothetical protein
MGQTLNPPLRALTFSSSSVLFYFFSGFVKDKIYISFGYLDLFVGGHFTEYTSVASLAADGCGTLITGAGPQSFAFHTSKCYDLCLFIRHNEEHLDYVRFQVLTAASMKFRIVLWDVLPCKIIVDRFHQG